MNNHPNLQIHKVNKLRKSNTHSLLVGIVIQGMKDSSILLSNPMLIAY